MHSRSVSLPLRWYFASLAGAILMAFGLVSLFEIRVDSLHKPFASQHQRTSSKPIPKPLMVQEQTRPARVLLGGTIKKNQSLWKLLVSPEMIDCAIAIIAGSFIILLLPWVQKTFRKRK